jgi:hypothetical protein
MPIKTGGFSSCFALSNNTFNMGIRAANESALKRAYRILKKIFR